MTKAARYYFFRFKVTALFLALPHCKMQGNPTRIARIVWCRWWPTSTKIEGEYLLQQDFLAAADVRGLKLLHVFEQIMTIIFSSFIIRTEIHRGSYICSNFRSYLPPRPGEARALLFIPARSSLRSEPRSGFLSAPGAARGWARSCSPREPRLRSAHRALLPGPCPAARRTKPARARPRCFPGALRTATRAGQ